MNAKITYTNEPLGELKVVPDFLPAPEELVFQDDTVKITITLSRSSVEFFKREAKKHHTQYQKMIRRLLDVYTQKHQQPLTKRSTERGTQRRAGELDRSPLRFAPGGMRELSSEPLVSPPLRSGENQEFEQMPLRGTAQLAHSAARESSWYEGDLRR
jgi:hypothetical protein